MEKFFPMENKPKKSSYRNIIKDTYGNEIPGDISFAEYWERQHLIEKYSMEESIRQKEERAQRGITKEDSILKAIRKGLFNTPKCNNHTEQKAEDGECCQTKNKK